MTAPSLGFSYLGLIDDMVLSYPWRFDVDERALNIALVTQVIDGRQILLNDGYLVNHPVARQALLDPTSLLHHLIGVGFVRVMARGKNDFSLAEMPVRMSATIPTFDDLVRDRVRGVKWAELKAALEKSDKKLRAKGLLMDWPAYDAGSGFALLARRIQERGASTWSLGMGRFVSQPLFRAFLAEFLARMEHDTRGARSHWELLAKQYALKTPETMDRVVFVRALMRLANEMYHYNMGVMLSAHHGTTVSVETQTSAAFDDLLITQDIYLDELNTYPRLSVPASLAMAHPAILAEVVNPESVLYELRTQWMAQRARWEQDHRQLWDRGASAVARAVVQDTKAAGEAYARALTAHFKNDVKHEAAEGLFNFAVGTLLKEPVALLTAGAGAYAGSVLFPGQAEAGIAAGAAAGWLFATAQKRVLGSVTKKFRLFALENQLVPDGLINRSQRIVEKIKARRVPSSIDIDPGVARILAQQMKPA